MSNRDWDESYQADEIPWDVGEVEPVLEAFVRERPLAPCRALRSAAAPARTRSGSPK